MKYTCYIVAFAALAVASWNVLMLQDAYALMFVGLAIMSMQTAIFFKKDRIHFRAIEVRRKPIIIHLPQFHIGRSDHKSV